MSTRHPNKRGPETVVKRGIRKEIEQRFSEMAMRANEVIARLSMMAAGALKTGAHDSVSKRYIREA